MMQAKTLVLVLGSVLFSVAGQLLLKSRTDFQNFGCRKQRRTGDKQGDE